MAVPHVLTVTTAPPRLKGLSATLVLSAQPVRITRTPSLIYLSQQSVSTHLPNTLKRFPASLVNLLAQLEAVHAIRAQLVASAQ